MSKIKEGFLLGVGIYCAVTILGFAASIINLLIMLFLSGSVQS